MGADLYVDVVIINTSDIEDEADYGGVLYELKKIGIRNGNEYQIDNVGDLLMYYDSYKRCKSILKRFGVKPVNILYER